MSNQWLRLWHDMPTDPKWRTIARTSGQPVSLVQAVYLHLLVDASRNVTRGHVTVTLEDLASALDVTEDQIQAILTAMEGRVVDAGKLSGWDARQPKKEDSGDASTGAKSAAERQREKRLRDAEKVDVTTSHDESRDVTLDKDKEEDKKKSISSARAAKKTASRKTSVSENFEPDANGVEAAKAGGLNLKAEVKAFIDHHDAKGSLMANWQAAWRTWVGKAIAFGHGTPSKAQGGDTSWLAATGFANVAEAQNARCHIGNAHQFRNGQRVEAHA